jgi:hypothetical protein
MQYRHIILSFVALCALVPALAAEGEEVFLMPQVSLICIRQQPALATTPLGTMISSIPEASRQVDAAKPCLDKQPPLSAEFCTELLNTAWKSFAERPATFRELIDKHDEVSRINDVFQCL